MTRNPVVHQRDLPELQKFRDAFVDRLRPHGRRFENETAFAKALGMSKSGLKKVLNGGGTCPKRMFDAMMLDPDILDDVCALYGLKLVPQENGDGRAAPTIVALLHEVIEAEADGDTDDTELLGMDDELAAVEKLVGGLRERVRRIKAARERVAEMV